MTVMRLAAVALLIFPALALGQAKEDEDGKVSNDQPGRPLQMSPASTEVKEAVDDFDRFRRRGAWERALKSLYTIPEDQALRFVDGDGGFIIPVARKRRSMLAAMPPEGQAAYRLFYDAEAKKLFEEAEGPAELKNLERVYSAYFLTSVGDNAADRLGDLYFESGRFDRAADCWLAILRERPDTDLSPALVSVKAAWALLRAGRRSEFEAVRAELADRHRDEKVTLGGVTAPPAAILDRLTGDENPATDAGKPATPAVEAGPDLAAPVDAAWQMRIAESIEAGMAPPELTQWESNPLSAAVPAATTGGTKLFVNYLGYVFALDMKSGKLIWRSAPFHQLKVLAMQGQSGFIDPGRFGVVASGDRVWTIGRDAKDPNFMGPFRLTCRRADNGEVAWNSSDLADYAQFDLFGPPLLAAGKLFVAAKGQGNPQQPGLPQQIVLAIRPHDGKILWKAEVGTFRQGMNNFNPYYGGFEMSPLPRLVHRAGAVYIDTHAGVLARLDADSGALDWGYGYRTDAVQGQGRFFFFNGYQQSEPTTASSAPLENGEVFLVKGAQSDRLYAVDPNRMKVAWERPIAKSARLLGVDDRAVYLGGPEVGAIDLKTKALLWATPVPNGSAQARVLVRPDGLWQLTPRGVFEIDPKSGAVRRIFRGQDLGAVGGDLLVADPWLLAISNRTISAYPLKGPRADSATTKARASNE